MLVEALQITWYLKILFFTGRLPPVGDPYFEFFKIFRWSINPSSSRCCWCWSWSYIFLDPLIGINCRSPLKWFFDIMIIRICMVIRMDWDDFAVSTHFLINQDTLNWPIWPIKHKMYRKIYRTFTRYWINSLGSCYYRSLLCHGPD